MLIKRFVSVVFGVCIVCVVNAQSATGSYVNNLRNELVKTWPHNRTINIVFHGHSVPSGYAQYSCGEYFRCLSAFDPSCNKRALSLCRSERDYDFYRGRQSNKVKND